jgi:pSer/pThr/pTyr-binding forkhead associated (FHA) protein
MMKRATINIGRDHNQDMVLTNTSVHRAHAVISRKPDGSFLLTNLRAKNGVYVNGDEVETDCMIKHGDTIELGEVHMKFQVV